MDPPALVLLGLIAGKTYYLTMVFGDRILRRGQLRTGLLVSGAVIVTVFYVYSSLLYVNLIYFPWPLPGWYGGTDWMLNSGLPLHLTRSSATDAAAVAIFVTYPIWFYLGTELAKAGHRLTRRQRTQERDRIIRDLSTAMFPQGGAIPPGAVQVHAPERVAGLFSLIPPAFADALNLLLFSLDSRFLVLVFTGRWKRFVDLASDWEKSKYVEVWESNQYLVGAAQAIRITLSYGYYTQKEVFERIGYNGPMEPSLPPWYPSVTTVERRANGGKVDSH